MSWPDSEWYSRLKAKFMSEKQADGPDQDSFVKSKVSREVVEINLGSLLIFISE